jgi:hypothetical protein
LLDSIVSGLTRELSLTAEQQAKLREVLQPHVAEARMTSIPILELYLAYYYASKITNEELTAFMSPAQIHSFRIFVLPVQDIGEMMEMEAVDE